eukprot:CAMPEP_0115674166 /NCGR_PEP_ID=MMETSP0272-20121206/53474_1 /TAXON_ID=71861 /ORGANISM="Scrippsiella trochoidea, Strain CCMP3099" /LENGTH=65 /DNA_ID=CAMNT_0003113053 /DNA_START=38 /DNA_END=235 /DNA_ORIENTATION=+
MPGEVVATTNVQSTAPANNSGKVGWPRPRQMSAKNACVAKFVLITVVQIAQAPSTLMAKATGPPA